MKKNEGAIYDVEFEETLKNMEKDNTGFFKTKHDPEHGWMLNNQPMKKLLGTEVEINGNKKNTTPGLQKVLTDKTFETAKSMKKMEKIVFRDILKKLNIIIVYQQKSYVRS